MAEDCGVRPAAVESGCDFLAADCWESKCACDIVVHGGGDLWHFLPCGRFGLDTQFLIQIRGLGHSRQPFRTRLVNTTG